MAGLSDRKVLCLKEMWLGGRDSNPDRRVPESAVLPLDDLPTQGR